MEILKKISKAFLRIALYLVVIAAVFYLTATLVFKDLEKKNTKLVTDAIPEMFPLLIVYPPTNSQPLSIKPIYYKNFNETLIQNRNYTFNIPEGKEAEINKLLKEQSRAFMKPRDFNWESENPWEAHIIVEKSENGKQAIRFFETWDDDRENVGWYEANGTKFTPVKHRLYFGGGGGILAFLGSILAFLILLLTKLWFKSFKQLRIGAQIGWRKYLNITGLCVGLIFGCVLLYFYLRLTGVIVF